MPPQIEHPVDAPLSGNFDWIKDPNLWGERLVIPEWEDATYRSKNGWQGTDLVHSEKAPVRITDYFVSYGPGNDIPNGSRGGSGTRLNGNVIYTEAAESHQGFCHGGSICSIMDDVVGWLGFCVTGECQPWSGFTVQINTRLMKPIAVGSSMVVTATIDRVERRKVFITAQIIDVKGDSSVVEHARCEGVVVVNRGVLQTE